MFQQSLENIELDKMRDAKTLEVDKLQNTAQFKCVTPDKKAASNAKGNQMVFSSNKKVSSFETPKEQAKIPAVVVQGDNGLIEKEENKDAVNEGAINDANMATEAKRKLMIRESTSNNKSGENAGQRKLDSIKRYIENDEDGSVGQGLVLSQSSKSVLGLEALQKEIGINQDVTEAQRSSIEVAEKYRTNDVEEVPDKLNEFNKSSARVRNPSDAEKYSPIWSSIKRRENIQRIDPIRVQNQMNEDKNSSVKKGQFAEIKLAPLRDLPKQNSFNKTQNQTHRLQRANLPDDLDDHDDLLNSTGSKAFKAMISNRDALSKQHSFNSPRSLQKQL